MNYKKSRICSHNTKRIDEATQARIQKLAEAENSSFNNKIKIRLLSYVSK